MVPSFCSAFLLHSLHTTWLFALVGWAMPYTAAKEGFHTLILLYTPSTPTTTAERTRKHAEPEERRPVGAKPAALTTPCPLQYRNFATHLALLHP